VGFSISITGCGIDIILSLNNQEKYIHSLIVVEKITYFTARSVVKTVLRHAVHARKNKQPNLHLTGDFSSMKTKITIDAVGMGVEEHISLEFFI
jgi:hypothetical protein